MRKSHYLIIIFIMLALLTYGCNNQSNPTNEPNEPQLPNQGNQTGNNEVVTPGKKVSFNEAFPKEAISNPQFFLEQLIPGFKIGMSSENIKGALGEPNDIIISQGPWGEESNLIYNNVHNYQVTLKVANNRLINFEISRYINSTGTVPKLVNKYKPEPGEAINYKELGFEGVILGFRVDEVISRFGDPLRSYLTYDEMYGYDLAMVYKGVTIHVTLGTESPYVQFIETNSLGNISTYRNISIGSSVQEVLINYGETGYTWEDAEFLIYSTNDYWHAIKFELRDNKVKEISIYNAS